MQRKSLRLAILAVVMSFGIGMSSGVALAVQGHMWNALGDLRAAATQLNEALPDKAGHRVTAMSLVNQAIGEVQAGIAAGR